MLRFCLCLVFGLTCFGSLFAQDEPPVQLVYPWISSNAQFESRIVVNNRANEPAPIFLTARRANGEVFFAERILSAKGFLNELPSELFPSLDAGAGFSLTVASQTSALGGRWLTFQRVGASQNSPSMGVAVSMQELVNGSHVRLGSAVEFGFLPSDSDFFAAVVLVNLGVQATDVSLQGTSFNGQTVFFDDTTVTDLEPLVPRAVLITDLAPIQIPVNIVASAETGTITGTSFIFNSSGEPAIGNVSGVSSPIAPVSFQFDFLQGLDGWQGGFADYPVGEEDFYELDFGWEALPSSVGIDGSAMRLTGNNHSDDLFQYATRQVSGLQPNTTYDVVFEMRVVTDAGAGCAGVGGSPGDSVYVKTGASVFEPLPVDESGTYRMNVDKGQQSQGGRAMIVADTLGIQTDCVDPQFGTKTIETSDIPFSFKTDGSGTVWLMAGIDSGFEATTTWYILDYQAILIPRIFQ